MTSIARHLRRSSEQFTRKVIALVLVEAVAVSSAVSVVAGGPSFPLPNKYRAVNAKELLSLWSRNSNPRQGTASEELSPYLGNLADPKAAFSTRVPTPTNPPGVVAKPGKVVAATRPMAVQGSTPQPGISGLQPNSGAPGSTITITGANFGSSQGSGSVTFNGAPATISSWSNNAIVATVPAGATSGNVVVTAAGGASGPAHFAVINPGGVSVDQVVSGGSFTPFFSTNAGNELLLAFVAAAPGASGSNGTITGLSSGNLTWTLVKRTNVQTGTAEIWRAFSPSPLPRISVSATTSNGDISMTVVSFMGVDTSGTNGSGAIGATGSGQNGSGMPTATLTTTRNNSLVFAVGEDPVAAIARTPFANQTIVNQLVNPCTATFPFTCPEPGDTFWVQQVDTVIPSSGTALTVGDSSPTNDPYNVSAVEILPAASPSTAPLITSLSAIAGSPGTSITISGAGFGVTQGTSTVTFNGTSATPSSWSATSIVVPVPSGATTGNVVVTVGGIASNQLRFIVANAGGLAIDQIFRSLPGPSQFSSIAGSTFSTTSGNEVLLALVGTAPNGTTGGTTITPLQGGGLNWVRVEIANTQAGTAEVWRAFSPYILSNVSVSYSPGPSTDILITVVALLGADTSGTSGSGAIGAIATANAASGAPSATLTSTRANSFVFGVGDDPSAGVARTLGANQTSLVQAVNNRCSGSTCQPGSYTLWSQQLTSSIAAPGTSVTINDTAPTTDAFNLSIVELLPAILAPSITSLSPNAGPIGTVVTISGANFGATQGTSTVTFAGVTALPSSWSSSSIVVPVPASVPLGPAAVVVTVPGAGASQPATFTVVAPLAITASAAPAANTAHWNNTNVTISYTCTGGVTPVNCPASQTVTTEGANQSFTATATDANNNAASVTTTLNIDKTPPALAITSPANNTTVTSSPVQVSGTVTDNLSGVASVACNSAAATVQSGTFSCSVALAPGPNTISVLAFDVAGNSATRSITVTLGPAITDFNPKVGPAGTAVSIVGTNLSVPPNATTVTFAGPSGPLTAKVNFSSATQLAVVVPTGAVTGPITISNAAGTASTATPFTVGPSQDFQVTVAPATATLPQGSVTSFAVSVSSAQSSFTQLATLSVSGMPQGVAAMFNPPQITAGASSTLLIDLGASTLAVGTFPFTIHATATVAGAQQDRTAGATLNVTAAGQTTLAGQVVTTLNQPILGATVSLDGLSVLTDGAGRFLLTGIQPGTGRPLSIDGHSATSPNATFPLIFEPVNIIIGRANVVSTPFHLPPIDTSQEVTINPNADTVAGNAAVPGLQMTIPKGANLRMLDGTLVTRTSITPLAPDRTPAPLPSTVGTNIVYTSQPGGAITSIPIPVVYPNLAGLNPGTEVDLWAFDHAHVNWFIYGKGQVSTDGRTINPEINPATGKPFGLPDFSWHFPNTGPNGNPSPDPNCQSNCPVDLSTGVKLERHIDVSWKGARGGIRFGRVYTSDLAQNCDSCPFGRGTTHNFDYRLSGNFTVGGAGRLRSPGEVTGRLYSFAGTLADGSLTFTTIATTSQLGDTIVRSPQGVLSYLQRNGSKIVFNSAGSPSSMSDANGNTTSLTYSNGLLTQITDSVGRTLNLTYDGTGRIAQIQDPLQRTWKYTYEGTPGVAGAPGLTTVTDPNGGVTRYTYVTGDLLSTVVDPRGNTVKQVVYENPVLSGGQHKVLSETYGDGGQESFSYGFAGNLITSSVHTMPAGRFETLRFSGSGYLLSRTDASGQTKTMTRTLTTNLPIQETDATGNTVVTRQFDAQGNITMATDRLNQSTQVQYDPVHNKPTLITDKRRNTWKYSYDPNGNLTSVTDPLNEQVTYGYDGLGQLTSITDALHGITRISYDQNGYPATITDPLGHNVSYVSDALGRVQQRTDALQRTSKYTYDVLGRLRTKTDPAGNKETYDYDANGNLITVTDPLGQTIAMAYDAKNRMVSKKDPLGNTTNYAYNQNDELVSVITPDGQTIQYTHDLRGKLSKVTEANGAVLQFGYDAVGHLVSVTDEKGNLTNYTYDQLNRIASKTDPIGRTSTVAYDANNNIVNILDGLGRTTSFTYDANNRRSQITYPDAVLSFQYDAAGRLLGVNDSEGGSIQWQYDAANHLIEEIQASGTLQYSYNEAGQRVAMTVNNGPPVQYTYDTAGRVQTITQGTDTFTYSYDQHNRISALQRPNGINTSWSYDLAGRLQQIQHGPNGQIETLSFSYSPDGRIISKQSLAASAPLPPSAPAATVDQANELTQFNGAQFSFDSEGKTISKTDSSGQTSYTWDARGRLVAVSLPNSQTVQYSYDAIGRRIARTAGGVTTQFTYDGQNTVLDTGSDGATVQYLNGLGIDNKLRLLRNNGSPLYFLQDQLGSTIALTDAAGATAERDSYDTFGNSSGGSVTRFGFTGRELDSVTGLIYYRSRWYNPAIGRFISPDPSQTSDGPNNYQYVHDSPLGFTDWTGLWTVSIGGSICVSFSYFAGCYNGGFVVDNQGNIGSYTTVGGGGSTPGASGGIGVEVGWSNARTINGLSGVFNQATATGGEGLTVAVTGFSGRNPEGVVTGGAVTVGGGGNGTGISGNTQVTDTDIIPLRRPRNPPTPNNGPNNGGSAGGGPGPVCEPPKPLTGGDNGSSQPEVPGDEGPTADTGNNGTENPVQPIMPELDGQGNPLTPMPDIPGVWQGYTSNGTRYFTNVPGFGSIP